MMMKMVEMMMVKNSLMMMIMMTVPIQQQSAVVLVLQLAIAINLLLNNEVETSHLRSRCAASDGDAGFT